MHSTSQVGRKNATADATLSFSQGDDYASSGQMIPFDAGDEHIDTKFAEWDVPIRPEGRITVRMRNEAGDVARSSSIYKLLVDELPGVLRAVSQAEARQSLEENAALVVRRATADIAEHRDHLSHCEWAEPVRSGTRKRTKTLDDHPNGCTVQRYIDHCFSPADAVDERIPAFSGGERVAEGDGVRKKTPSCEVSHQQRPRRHPRRDPITEPSIGEELGDLRLSKFVDGEKQEVIREAERALHLYPAVEEMLAPRDDHGTACWGLLDEFADQGHSRVADCTEPFGPHRPPGACQLIKAVKY
jgi:hypothetical protein